MNWAQVETKEGWVKIPRNWLFLHYYEAISILFKVENALRALVYIVLKNEHGLVWVDISISSDDASKTTIAALAKKRIEQSQNYGYLGYQIGSPLMHLTSGELVRIITSDPYWPHFKKYFNASRQVVTLKLEEIGSIRNSLAHFRPLTSNDVEVVKQNANQVFSNIEQTLAEIIRGGQRVPTNTTSQWYLDLCSLGGQHTQIVHNQSSDELWVRTSLQFKFPILRRYPDKPDDYASFTVLDVNPVGMLQRSETLRQLVTCVLERTPHVLMPGDYLPEIIAHVYFTFSKNMLEKHHKEIKEEFESLLALIDSEADLIRDDNLARGEVVHIAHVSANKRKSETWEYWSFNMDPMKHSLSQSDPPEFWGAIDMYTGDFVSDAHLFPWMPVSVSFQKFPF